MKLCFYFILILETVCNFSVASEPKAKLHFAIDGNHIGNIQVTLFNDTVPKTVNNFLALGNGKCGYGYKNSKFHRIIPGFMIQGGDFTNGDGTGGKSVCGEKFPDENFEKTHDKAGTFSMANSGPDSNGSQFFITTAPQPHLDGKHIVFGQIADGDKSSVDILRQIEAQGSESGDPLKEVTLLDVELVDVDPETLNCSC